MRRAIDFYMAIFSVCLRRTVQLHTVCMPPLVIAFDAQVEPDVYLGGGYFVYDPQIDENMVHGASLVTRNS